MCGRFVQASAPTLLAEHFHVDELIVDATLEPHYNVAPRAEVLTIVDRDHTRSLGRMRWGLVPFWAETSAIGDHMINARAETLLEKAAFRSAFERRRCIVPVDGFYEWQATPGPKKQPMYIHSRDNAPLALAGLWESWRDQEAPGAPWLRTCSVITTNANSMMQPVHDRMPVILEEADWDEWLDREVTKVGTVVPMLGPPADDRLVMHPVSTRVNSARHDDATLIEREDPLTLFP